ncbi:MAG TPA: hypothetical protein DCE41_08145 [Cytophagales bacterium]|nr:hypothetical protein [Cytophagales bacterium]HAA18545.1 hypothetical protein [Cytophagales bacterium]HAP62931.1 hypothetical protein [Cytophagales bacterium]
MDYTKYPVIHQNEEGNISLRKPDIPGFIFMQLSGKMELEDYKAAFIKATDALEEVGAQTLLVEASKLNQTDPEGRAWLMKRHLPDTMKRLGRLNVGMISPRSMFQKITLNLAIKALKALGKPVDVKVCDDMQEATAWLAKYVDLTKRVNA